VKAPFESEHNAVDWSGGREREREEIFCSGSARRQRTAKARRRVSSPMPRGKTPKRAMHVISFLYRNHRAVQELQRAPSMSKSYSHETSTMSSPSTCHVILEEDVYDKLEEPDDDENVRVHHQGGMAGKCPGRPVISFLYRNHRAVQELQRAPSMSKSYSHEIGRLFDLPCDFGGGRVRQARGARR
jgi:hypothetical protein